MSLKEAPLEQDRDPSTSTRYHGLDALRGMAMLLGIVLHAALPYMPDVEGFWPVDDRYSPVVSTIFEFIHIWRMPLFFILAGFFANLVVSRKSWKRWWGNRLLRIGLPIVVFFPLMSLTLPWIFHYGKTGNLLLFYSNEGQPFHLWFLWHLIIFVIFTAIFRLPYLLGIRMFRGLSKNRWPFPDSILYKMKSILAGIVFRSRFPLAFIILCWVMNISTGGELIGNPLASGLYFASGYSLYGNASLFTFLKAHWRYYLLVGLVSFTIYMILNVTEVTNIVTDIYSQNITSASEQEKERAELLWAIIVFIKIICAVFFSYALIGLSESLFGSYNAKLRFISDGAYWMYLIHLPIVTLITFMMFKIQIPIEVKFLIAIVMTSTICLGTYTYLVRPTLIGILLNGKRYPVNMGVFTFGK